MSEEVILVDEFDREVGTLGKLETHRQGLLHRAISVFVFHPDGRVMLQRRAADKYHSEGLWTNTCCSHPRPGESVAEAAARRLEEEMGIRCTLVPVHTFTYRVTFGNGLTEHEFDHAFVGITEEEPRLTLAEASDWMWMYPEDLLADLEARPERYTYWLKASFLDVLRAKGSS